MATPDDSRKDNADKEERDIERLLRKVGPREQPPEYLLSQWDQHFRQELSGVRQQRGQRQRRLMGICAALLVSVSLGIALLREQITPSPAPTLATLTQFRGDQVLIDAESAAQAGSILTAGSRLITGPESFAALRYRGHDLRLNRASELRVERDVIRLERGQLYVSSRGESAGITVQTADGSVSDIGTQFLVSVTPEGTSARVRLGTIRVENDAGRFETSGDSMQARELRFQATASPARYEVSPRGPGWDWIYQQAPAFQLDGKSVHAFLSWASGETGRELRFASEEAEIYARTSILHGDYGRPDPETAANAIIATTDLRIAPRVNGTMLVTLLRGDRP